MNPCCSRFLMLIAISWLCSMAVNGQQQQQQQASVERTRLLNKRVKRFACPGDGKWPDENDCERYFTCSGTQEPTGGWCGPGMAFDTESQRCDMASGVKCTKGDRPDWKPPDNWEGKTKETTTTTKKASGTSKSAKTDADGAGGSSGGGAKEVVMKENDRCNFKGLVSDKENCQSYFYCKDAEAKKALCNDRQLFDEETKSCKEFKAVYCGDRPVNDKGKDQCRSRPNGVYPNIENGCSEFYQCQSQKKVKSGECPQGLKFNMLTLRCDWPSNVPVPCGTKLASSNAAATTTTTIFATSSSFLLSSLLYSILYF